MGTVTQQPVNKSAVQLPVSGGSAVSNWLSPPRSVPAAEREQLPSPLMVAHLSETPNLW